MLEQHQSEQIMSFFNKNSIIVQGKADSSSSIAKIANKIEPQSSINEGDNKTNEIQSPSLQFEINLNSNDQDSDDVDISQEIPLNPGASANNKHNLLSLKRPVSSPTFSRSHKRNSSDNKDLNNNNNNNDVDSKGLASLGRVLSAPSSVSSSSSSSTKNNTQNSTLSNNNNITSTDGTHARVQTKRSVLPVHEKRESGESARGYGFLPINISTHPIDVLFIPNPTFEALHVKAMCSLKDMLPQEERASFFAQHYQLPLRLYYKLVDSNPQKKPQSGIIACIVRIM
jgi:hypothetical protein